MPDASPDVSLVRDIDRQLEIRDALVPGGVGAIAVIFLALSF